MDTRTLNQLLSVLENPQPSTILLEEVAVDPPLFPDNLPLEMAPLLTVGSIGTILSMAILLREFRLLLIKFFGKED